MTAKLRIVPRNFHYEATLGTEFPAALGCSIVNTQNRKRSRVWRSDETTAAFASDDQYVTGTFEDGLTRTVDFFGMFRHRCHGGQVRLQLYSDDGWTTQVYDSGALDVINVATSEGADWGIDPHGIGETDPLITQSPYWLWLDPVACLSYRVSFSDNSAAFGAAYWEVGTFALGRSFETAYPPGFGAELGVIDLTESDRSRGGSLYTNVGAQARTMKLALERVPEEQRAAWIDIVRRTGLGQDIVISLFAEESTRRERDHTMLGTFSALDPIGRQVRRLTKAIQFQEA